jgi:hypothetical protein
MASSLPPSSALSWHNTHDVTVSILSMLALHDRIGGVRVNRHWSLCGRDRRVWRRLDFSAFPLTWYVHTHPFLAYH